jgi:hypothetical protein
MRQPWGAFSIFRKQDAAKAFMSMIVATVRRLAVAS